MTATRKKAVSKGWGPKLTGRLADYANASKGTILLGDIQAHMIKEHAKPSDRRQDIIHPSEMAKTDWCPRGTYYRIAACRAAGDPYLKPAESIGVQLLNIFDEGHLIHTKWQTRLKDMGILWGNWYCQACQARYNNCLVPERGCSGANDSNTLIYTEVPLRAEQYLIAGHADGAIPHLNSLIEIKSVGAGTVRIETPEIYQQNTDGQKIDLQGLWKAIEEPFPSHIRQGQLYLRLCNIMGLPYDQIIFIYEAKFNQGVKEFVVKYDPHFCEEMLDWCDAIRVGLEIDSAPQCPTGTTCKDCERYGAQKSDSIRVEQSTEPQGIEANRTTVRRSAGITTRVIRPS